MQALGPEPARDQGCGQADPASCCTQAEQAVIAKIQSELPQRLASQGSLEWVTRTLDFASDAAFIGFFRRMTELPPRACMESRGRSPSNLLPASWLSPEAGMQSPT